MASRTAWPGSAALPCTRRTASARPRLPLQVPDGLALAGGTLDVSYRDRPEAGGKLLAQASLNLP